MYFLRDSRSAPGTRQRQPYSSPGRYCFRLSTVSFWIFIRICSTTLMCSEWLYPSLQSPNGMGRESHGQFRDLSALGTRPGVERGKPEPKHLSP